MIALPVTSDGSRIFEINTGVDLLEFRTYFSDGQSPVWLLDVGYPGQPPLMSGLALVPGAENILKGGGDILEGYQLYVYLEPGKSPGGGEALGRDLILILYNPGEENLFKEGDPLMTIGSTWVWGSK